jgi:BlaI family transcriptional regulator, penicillinase repressor
MPQRPPLSRSELEIARQLWNLKEASVRQVHEAFPGDRRPEFTVVQTYLRRLESKGYAASKLEGRSRVYRPTVKPRMVIRETVDDLVDRLFGGETLPLVRHLIEDRSLTDEEIQQLRELLDKLEEGEK